jgi:NAD-dependent SIR2 family protein deacetylase
MTGYEKPHDARFNPRVADAKEAAKTLKNCKNIAILTGAGLSAASGIPTFRGAEGFWTKSYAGEKNASTICTMNFFNKNPEANW